MSEGSLFDPAPAAKTGKSKESGPSAKEQADEIVRQLVYHDYLYWQKNAPEISDAEYDQLREKLKQIDPEHPQLRELGERTWKDKFHPPIDHAVPMLSIEKTFKPEEVVQWGQDCGAFDHHADDGIVACYKVDGSSCSLIFQDGMLVRAVTRGNGRTGNDITLNARRVRSIPLKFKGAGRLEVRGEIYFKTEDYENAIAAQGLDPNKTNPRNLCAGSIMQNDPREVEKLKLSFMAHGLVGVPPGADGKSEASGLKALEKLGFETPFYRLIKKPDEVAAVVQEIDEKRDKLPYETDGVVFTINRLALHQELGFTSHHPRYRIAFKFGRQQGVTTLKHIIWHTTRSGRVAPAMQTEPIRLGGATVTLCTLHNAKMVKEMGLRDGDQVLLEREVIPHLVKRVSGKDGGAELPTKCGECSTTLEWDETETNLVCPNQGGCPSQVLDYLQHYVSRPVTNMMGIGELLVEKLVAAGLLKTPADFYKLTEEILLEHKKQLEPMGEGLAKKIVASIQSKKNQTVAVFLVSLGIRGLGPSVARRLSDHFGSLEAITEATPEKLMEVEGIAETMAEGIRSGLQDRKQLIHDLLKFVTLEKTTKVEGPLSGKSFCLTGHIEFDYNGKHYDARGDIEELIKSKGGAIKSVSKKLDFLVVGEGGGSKREKAEKAGVKCIEGKELLPMLG